MSYNTSLISPSPREDSKGGSFLEESSGEGDDSNVLGGDNLVTGPLGAVLLVMCLTGMVGNIYMVAVASGRMAGCSAGSLGVYLINLALADLLYLSNIPFVVCTYFAHDWFFGDVGCRLLLSLDLLTMHASIFLLTTMSLERYWAVAKPLWARRASSACRKLASAVLWLLSLLLVAPMMVMTELREGDGPCKCICVPTWTPSAFRLYLMVLFATSVLAPGAVLGIMYALSRISAIVVACWACFLPFWAWQLAGLYQGEGLGIGPTAQACLNFGVTRLAYGRCQPLPLHPACQQLPPVPCLRWDWRGAGCSSLSTGCGKPQHPPGSQGVSGSLRESEG